MHLVALLLACSDPAPPPAGPAPVDLDGAVEIRLDDDGVHVGGRHVGTTRELLTDLTDGLYHPLVDALAGAERAAVRIPPDTPWMALRKLVNSAGAAQVGELRLATADRLWDPARPARSRWASPTCEPGSVGITGVDMAFTLEVHGGPDRAWALASARFRAVAQVDGAEVPLDELPPSCWSGARCDLLPEAARPACEAALASSEPAPARVDVAGRWGCLLPLAEAPADLARWTSELAGLLEAWGVRADSDVMLIPEANVPFSTLAAVLDAFASLDQPPPTLGLPLVEGNDGPPICEAAIRDREALDRAMGAWFGARLHEASP